MISILWDFAYLFVASLALGMAFGLGIAFLLKLLRSRDSPQARILENPHARCKNRILHVASPSSSCCARETACRCYTLERLCEQPHLDGNCTRCRAVAGLVILYLP